MKKLSREEMRIQKELEEARKQGKAPAEKDETGREINPHIPQYLREQPFYLAKDYQGGAPSLSHQRSRTGNVEHSTAADLARFHERIVTNRASSYRAGACTNCGSMGHAATACLERPRKRGARWTQTDIAPDEQLVEAPLGFEAKRDRWNGYNPEHYDSVVDRFRLLDEEHREYRRTVLAKEVEDRDEYADDEAVLAQAPAGTERTTARNLRIREDTAKYLRNLDLQSAYYDPKTHSMRDNPTPDRPLEELTFAGDNFVRSSGDVKRFLDFQRFAWEASERGNSDVSLQALPSHTERLFKEYERKREEISNAQARIIEAKYGANASEEEQPSKEWVTAQSEQYIEYAADGTRLDDARDPRAITISSRYNEDDHPGNHSSIWGSYWEDGRWGYACCHALDRRVYCTGDAGIEARKAERERQRSTVNTNANSTVNANVNTNTNTNTTSSTFKSDSFPMSFGGRMVSTGSYSGKRSSDTTSEEEDENDAHVTDKSDDKGG